MKSGGPGWVPLCQRDKISFIWLLAICANQLAAYLIWTPVGVLNTPYTKKFGFNTVETALYLEIGPICGIIVPPLIAAWSDVTTLSWGRRRVWLVIGEALSFLGLMLLVFSQRVSSSKGGQLAAFVLGQFFVSVGGNTFMWPGRAMCSDVAPPHQQVLVGNIVQIYNGVSGVISNLMGALQLYRYTSMTNEQFVLLISCVVGFTALAISVLTTPEEPLTEKPEMVNPFKLMASSFKFMTKDLWLIWTAFLCFQLAANQIPAQGANFMGKNVFHGTPNVGTAYDDGVAQCQILSLIQTLCQVFLSFTNTKMSEKIGLRWTWVLGMIACFIANILFFGVLPKWTYLVSYVFFAFAITIGNSIPFTIVSLVAKPEQMAGIMSIMTLASNIGGLFCQLIFTLGFGSIPKFVENAGPVVGISAFPLIVSIVLGLIAIKSNAKISDTKEAEKSSSDERPEAL